MKPGQLKVKTLDKKIVLNNVIFLSRVTRPLKRKKKPSFSDENFVTENFFRESQNGFSMFF